MEKAAVRLPSFLLLRHQHKFARRPVHGPCLIIMNYHLQLIGYVGSASFNARTTRALLAQYPGKHVDVLIDSFGGSLAEGLSICGAFRDHGDVTVHFRGMNASAATIASMGARKIIIAPESMYLVHKVSLEFFDWASRNADQLEDFIKALNECKEDLDAMDRNIAELYASRCKRPAKDLLDLMKAGKWLTPSEAQAWGLVDEITEGDRKPAAISKQLAENFKACGVPLPPVPVVADNQSLLDAIRDIVKSIFKNKNMDPIEQTQTPENAQEPVNASEHPDYAAELTALRQEISELRSQLQAMSAPEEGQTTAVVATPDAVTPETNNNVMDGYFKTTRSASKLFNSIP